MQYNKEYKEAIRGFVQGDPRDGDTVSGETQMDAVVPVVRPVTN